MPQATEETTVQAFNGLGSNAFIRNDAYDATSSTTSQSVEDLVGIFSDSAWNTNSDALRVEDAQFRQSLDGLHRGKPSFLQNC